MPPESMEEKVLNCARKAYILTGRCPEKMLVGAAVMLALVEERAAQARELYRYTPGHVFRVHLGGTWASIEESAHILPDDIVPWMRLPKLCPACGKPE